MTDPRRPRLGDDVVYVSEVDNGPGGDVLSPAKVLRTRSATVPVVIDHRWTPETWDVTTDVGHRRVDRPAELVEELPDDLTVDLLVHGLAVDYRRYAVPHGRGRGRWMWHEGPDL